MSKSFVKVQYKVIVVAVLFISISPVKVTLLPSTTMFVPVVLATITIESLRAEIVPEFVIVTSLNVPPPSPISIASPFAAVASIVPELLMVAPEPSSLPAPFPKSIVNVSALIVPELVMVAFVEFSPSIA